MLLRSITEHVRTQNWFAVVLDFVIVVIGVYIGIQVSNWNDARLDAQRGEYFAARLLADLQAEFLTYEQETDYYSTVHDYAVRAEELLDMDDPEFDNEFVVSAYNASQFIYAEPSQSTYDELLATGNLYLLKNENLRNAAIFLYSTTVRSRLSSHVRESAYRERLRRIMPYDVQQAVREQCGDVIDEITGFATSIPANCRIDFGIDRIAEATQVIRNDSLLRADLVYLLSSIGPYISDTVAVRRQAEQRLDGSYVNPASLIAE
jgi:hypothetical protein